MEFAIGFVIGATAAYIFYVYMGKREQAKQGKPGAEANKGGGPGTKP